MAGSRFMAISVSRWLRWSKRWATGGSRSGSEIITSMGKLAGNLQAEFKIDAATADRRHPVARKVVSGYCPYREVDSS